MAAPGGPAAPQVEEGKECSLLSPQAAHANVPTCL